MNIVLSSYVIFIFTSLLDTPAVYIARRMAPSAKKEPEDHYKNAGSLGVHILGKAPQTYKKEILSYVNDTAPLVMNEVYHILCERKLYLRIHRQTPRCKDTILKLCNFPADILLPVQHVYLLGSL